VSGTPILGLVERIKSGDENMMKVYSEHHGVPRDDLIKLVTPEKVVGYFAAQSREALERMGYALDWRRDFKTDDPEYKRFIEWQFLRLKEMGYVKRGSHPVRYCPRCDNPVEDHDLLEGENATLIDYVLIKFKFGDLFLPAATLRPETVFGVTNMFLNPGTDYVKTKMNGENWIISEEAAEKLKYQGFNVVVLEEIKGEALIGNRCENPLTGEEIVILPADFVDPDSASGVVMSVPGHAPYDWIALQDLKNEDEYRSVVEGIEPISIIKAEGLGEYPAVEIIEELGASNQEDPLVEHATKIVYKREFHTGVMRENTPYEGMPVKEIKDVLVKDLMEQGIADIMYEFSEKPVVCRCGTQCIVKTVQGQWFITYGDRSWKESAHELIDRMKIKPDEYVKEFHEKVDWMQDKACARRKGLGTRLPWDKEWVIESLSDSTIYMSYYPIIKHIKEKRLKATQLTSEFFDYVFLGKDLQRTSRITGIAQDVLEEIRHEFLYWYPLDWRCSGKDLIPNHLTFFLFNHIALFPEELLPCGMEVNGYVSIEGEKLSKSKGPVLPVLWIIHDYGADIGRMYISSIADPKSDADFKHNEVEAIRTQIFRFYNLATDIIGLYNSVEGEEEYGYIDRWLSGRAQQRIKAVTAALEEFEVREAARHAFVEYMSDIRWYFRRVKSEMEDEERKATIANTLYWVLDIWVRLMAPFTPHLCEEIWERMGKESFISNSEWPKPEEELIDTSLERSEELIRNTISDIQEIKKVARIETINTINLYVAPDWKWKVLETTSSMDVGQIMKEVMKDEEVRKQGKEVSKFARQIVEKRMKVKERIDEYATLKNAAGFIASEVSATRVEIIRAEESAETKARQAIPTRPAILIE
jgi:leucyl-tRNA synthetase